MSLNKSISKGYERRRQYYGAKAVDHTCRNNGSCAWCRASREYKNKKREAAAAQS